MLTLAILYIIFLIVGIGVVIHFVYKDDNKHDKDPFDAGWDYAKECHERGIPLKRIQEDLDNNYMLRNSGRYYSGAKAYIKHFYDTLMNQDLHWM